MVLIFIIYVTAISFIKARFPCSCTCLRQLPASTACVNCLRQLPASTACVNCLRQVPSKPFFNGNPKLAMPGSWILFNFPGSNGSLGHTETFIVGKSGIRLTIFKKINKAMQCRQLRIYGNTSLRQVTSNRRRHISQAVMAIWESFRVFVWNFVCWFKVECDFLCAHGGQRLLKTLNFSWIYICSWKYLENLFYYGSWIPWKMLQTASSWYHAQSSYYYEVKNIER